MFFSSEWPMFSMDFGHLTYSERWIESRVTEFKPEQVIWMGISWSCTVPDDKDKTVATPWSVLAAFSKTNVLWLNLFFLFCEDFTKWEFNLLI